MEAVVNKWDKGYSLGYEAGRRNAAILLHHEIMGMIFRFSMSTDPAKRAVVRQLEIAIETIWDRDDFQKSGNK